MMTRKELGEQGEMLAKVYLLNRNYEILETNWRYSRAEIDLIVKKNGVLIFVEVKTRTNDYWGEPASFVNQKKEDLMITAASVYMEKINHEWEIRFDIIGILWLSEKDYEIKHYEDAFFPGLGYDQC